MDKTKQRNNMHVKIICFLIAWTLLLVSGILTVMTNETLSFLFQVSIPIQATSRRLCNSPGRICNPVPAMNTLPAPPLNAIFIKSCYSYYNVTSYNTCCRLRDYREQPDKIMMCLRKLTKEIKPKNISQGDDDAMRSTDCRSWVFEGDSHMRYIFVSLVYTFNKTDLKYRFPRRMKSWLNFNQYTKNMRTTVYHEDIEIMVHSLPVCITFLWDPMLQRLPRLMDEWQNNEERKPTLLVLGSGLHFMANRKSVIDYKDYITKISLKLSRLAESAHVIYKLVDHLQILNEKDRMAPAVIHSFNNATNDIFAATRVVVWDSNLPLTDMYNDECRRHRKTQSGLRLWACEDKQHIGYIVINQYANMLLNRICNSVMGNDVDYYCR